MQSSCVVDSRLKFITNTEIVVLVNQCCFAGGSFCCSAHRRSRDKANRGKGKCNYQQFSENSHKNHHSIKRAMQPLTVKITDFQTTIFQDSADVYRAIPKEHSPAQFAQLHLLTSRHNGIFGFVFRPERGLSTSKISPNSVNTSGNYKTPCIEAFDSLLLC